MKTSFRFVGIALVVVIGVVATTAFSRQQMVADQAIQDTATVSVSDIPVQISLTGSMEPVREVPLAFGATYVVSEVLVEEGSAVSQGQVLARLETSDFDLALASAEIASQRQQNNFDALVASPRDVDLNAALAAIGAAEANMYAASQSAPSSETIEVARLDVEMARNQLWQAQLNRDITLDVPAEFRDRQLGDGGNANAQELQLNDQLNQLDVGISIAGENYQDTLNRGPDGGQFGSARQQLVQAEINLDNLRNPDPEDVEQMALRLHQSMLNVENVQVQITDLQIVAPFDGIVLTNNLSVGELPPSGPALVLADSSAMAVNIAVDEVDVVRLAVGQPVQLRVDALPETVISGQIAEISLLPLETETAPTYLAKIILDPTFDPIRIGMSVTATVDVDDVRDAMVLPSRFVQFEDGQAYVTILRGSRPQRIPVTVGYRTETQTQILTGVQPGQQVVLIDNHSGS